MRSEAQHRHPQNKAPSLSEASSLLRRHFSMQTDEEMSHARGGLNAIRVRWMPMVGLTALGILVGMVVLWRQSVGVVPIEHADEYWQEIDAHNNLKIWYRTWGNRREGIPILFVHGGPGNAIADYHNGNKRFFSERDFFVIEIDQRGTGKSQPSVRDSWHNMAYYKNISIDAIAADFELVREALGVEQWLVWGGSFGSTIGINYGTRYPKRCLALILRGIYLDTDEEVRAVYSQKTYQHNPDRLAEFKILYNYAAAKAGDEPLDPNDAERLLRIYEGLIQSGDRHAIWHWHVFENNLMEEDSQKLLDPSKIDKKVFPEAQSVAFFETRLWLHGSFEAPSNLQSRINQLAKIPVWICQGRRDEVCPPKYARMLVDDLDDQKAVFTARFIDAGHEDSDPVMAECLKESLYDFMRQFHWKE